MLDLVFTTQFRRDLKRLYAIDHGQLILTASRTGSHAELF